jgi:hypothetical protein
MSSTPEGKVKDVVKAFLRERKIRTLAKPIHDAVGFYRMHVPSGYGEPALDIEGCYKGFFFSAEIKAEGHTPSGRQRLIGTMHLQAGGFTCWGDNAADVIAKLTGFFTMVDRQQ